MRINIFLFASLCLSLVIPSHLLICCWCILLVKVNEKLEIKGVQGMQSIGIVALGTEQGTEMWI